MIDALKYGLILGKLVISNLRLVILTATRTIFSEFSDPLSLRTWNHSINLIKHHNYERTDYKPWMTSELQSVVYFSNEFEFKKEKKNNNKLWILFFSEYVDKKQNHFISHLYNNFQFLIRWSPVTLLHSKSKSRQSNSCSK